MLHTVFSRVDLITGLEARTLLSGFCLLFDLACANLDGRDVDG